MNLSMYYLFHVLHIHTYKHHLSFILLLVELLIPFVDQIIESFYQVLDFWDLFSKIKNFKDLYYLFMKL